MRLVAVSEETDCLRTRRHCEFCTGVNHVCYRCGMYIAPCNCPRLGSLLDY